MNLKQPLVNTAAAACAVALAACGGSDMPVLNSRDGRRTVDELDRSYSAWRVSMSVNGVAPSLNHSCVGASTRHAKQRTGVRFVRASRGARQRPDWLPQCGHRAGALKGMRDSLPANSSSFLLKDDDAIADCLFCKYDLGRTCRPPAGDYARTGCWWY
jgi:hypothetical protein